MSLSASTRFTVLSFGLVLATSFSLAGCGPSNAPANNLLDAPSTSPSPASKISAEIAREVASKSECAQLGEISQSFFYNPSSQTWWFDIDHTDKPNCKPACVVSEVELKASVNWRCSGGLAPKQLPPTQ